MQQRRRSPLVTSVDALMGLAGSILVLSLAGMTVYAGGHLRNADAPLQPAAASAAPAPAPLTITTSPTTGRLQLSRGVTTTTTPSITRTHHS
jgi:hypothetical protein